MSLQRLARQWKQRALLPARRSSIAASLQAKLPSPILQLQRILGNRRLAQLIRARRVTPQGKIIRIQRKLTVGTPNDQYEQEVDRIARQVISMPKGTPANTMQRGTSPEGTMEDDKDRVLQAGPLAAGITSLEQKRASVNEENEEAKDEETPIRMRPETSRGNNLQLQPVDEEEETESVQAKSSALLAGSFQAAEDVEAKLNRSKGGGNPLPDSVRSYMEARFGVDFSRVRTHTDSKAVQMNRDVGAKAFTHGSDIYYGANNSPGHLELTAHELTHVVQQTGRVPVRPKRQEGTASSVYQSRRPCSAFNTAGAKEKERNPTGFFRGTVFSPAFIARQRGSKDSSSRPSLKSA